MTTQYQLRTDSMDDINEEEKAYSNHSDEDSTFKSSQNNSFMGQVRQRRTSFSYNESDSPMHIDSTYSTYDTPEFKYENRPKNSLSNSGVGELLTMNRNVSDTDTQTISKPMSLLRRHSADKILCKPSVKNINSVDYLNRMIITLRSKIHTYKEDLHIAAELGQNLFSEKAQKDLLIEQYRNEMSKLKVVNDELSNVKNQLLQTNQLDLEHTKRLETDILRQKSSHSEIKNKYSEECEVLREQLQHSLSDIRHLQQLTDRQRIEIETLETRNEQISQNAGETIDDLSRELAEEKDGHSNLKHKYQKIHHQLTKAKINYEKRGTEIMTLKKQLQDKDIQILSQSGVTHNKTNGDSKDSGVSRQQIKLLLRKIDNYKDELQGLQKHVDLTKSYLKTTMNYLEHTGLMMRPPDIDKIYTLCKNARQFLGINKPPPDPVYEESPEPPPELPKERSPEPLPNDSVPSPSLPREPTPPLEVSTHTNQPISVPSAPKTPTPPPARPPTLPTNTHIPQPSEPLPPPIKPKINNTAQLPPMLPPSTPSQPLSLPLPPPKSPHNTAVKVHSTPAMPAQTQNPRPIPKAPTRHNVPSMPLPKEVIPTPKRFSSAMQPRNAQIIPKNVPSVPKPQTRGVSSLPMPSDSNRGKVRISAQAMMPSVTEPALPPPMMPNDRESMNTAPQMPKIRQTHKTKVYSTPQMPHMPIPKAPTQPNIPSLPLPKEVIPTPKRFSSAMLPKNPKITPTKTAVSPPKPHSIPSVPMPMPSDTRSNVKINSKAMVPRMNNTSRPMPPPIRPNDRESMNTAPQMPKTRKTHKTKVHSSPQMPHMPIPKAPTQPNIPSLPLPKEESKQKIKVVNTAMSPPTLPPSIPSPPTLQNSVPAPRGRDMLKMEAVSTKVVSNNKKKKKVVKKRRVKKKAKKKDGMEEQKQHLTVFFSTYSDTKNWTEGGKENGVQKYILKFAEREPLHARMAFLYSMTLYLGQIVGVNKRCITHAFMLFKSVRAQIDTLSEEFALILQTLEHHNDDKLWKYVYSFLYNAAAYFKHIQRFVGTRTSVDNPRKYSRALKAGSRDFSTMNTNRRESSFRKLSGLSEVSGPAFYDDTGSNISGISDKPHQVYGSSGMGHNGKSNGGKSKKSHKKKKKSSYAKINNV